MARRSRELYATIPPDRESGVRVTRASSSPSSPSSPKAMDAIEDLRAIATALTAAAMGFDVCARRARTKDVGDRMQELATDAKTLADEVAARVPSGVRKLSTSERLRWEWLASTAALLDGGAEGRLADEANRHLASASVAASRLEDEDLLDLVARVETLAARGRVAAGAARASQPPAQISA